MVPVTGTNLWTLATTYIAEFTIPMQDLQKRTKDLTNTTLKIVLAILIITIVLVGGHCLQHEAGEQHQAHDRHRQPHQRR